MIKNILDIDEVMLVFTEKLARKIYRFCGIDNFSCAKICIFWFSISSILETSLIFERIKEPSVFIWCTISAMIPWFIWFRLRPTTLIPSQGFRNPLRVKLLQVRFYLLMLMIFLLTHETCSLFVENYQYHLLEYGISFSSKLAYVFLLYFISIEPEPPSESKLKKFLGTLRNMFAPDALPEPA